MKQGMKGGGEAKERMAMNFPAQNLWLCFYANGGPFPQDRCHTPESVIMFILIMASLRRADEPDVKVKAAPKAVKVEVDKSSKRPRSAVKYEDASGDEEEEAKPSKSGKKGAAKKKEDSDDDAPQAKSGKKGAAAKKKEESDDDAPVAKKEGAAKKKTKPEEGSDDDAPLASKLASKKASKTPLAKKAKVGGWG